MTRRRFAQATWLSMVFALTLVSSAAQAQSWTSLGPESAEVTAAAVDPAHPETLYVGTAEGGVFRSEDRAGTWKAMTAPAASTIHVLAIAPGAPSGLFAATSGGLFKSTDRAASWAEVATGLSGTDASLVALAIAPSAPATMYAASNVAALSAGVEILKTTDAGQTWQKLQVSAAHATVKALAVDPANASIVYAGTACCGGGLFKSTDGGATWTDVTTGISSKLFDVLAVEPGAASTVWAATPTGLYKSTDGAATWQGLSLPYPVSDRIGALVFDPATAGTVYLTLGQRVLKSTDGGATWANASDGMSANDYSGTPLTSLVLDPTTPTRLYAGARGDGVFVTEDGAGSWTLANSGLKATQVISLLVDTSVSPQALFVGTGASGVFRSESHGAAWTKLLVATGARGLTMVPGPPKQYYAAFNGWLLRSTDGINDWAVAPSPTTLGDAGMVEATVQVVAAVSSRLYVSACSQGVFRSDDQGQTWTATGDLSGRCIQHIAIDPNDPDTVFLSASGGWPNPALLKSTDGGASWQVVEMGVADPFPAQILIDPANSQNVLVAMLSLGGGPAGLYRSQNGGTTWSAVSAIPGNVVQLHLEPTTHVLYAALHNTGVFKSADFGNTWADLTFDLPSFLFSSLAADPQGRVFLGTADLGAFSLEAGAVTIPDGGVLIGADAAFVPGGGGDGGTSPGAVGSGCGCSKSAAATTAPLALLLLALALGLRRLGRAGGTIHGNR